ncbi:MAG: RNA 3'-terminal phosphate cyclase [Candidatus Micrarchaeia archaeon]|jgi:RNA 3'-terminal phosphate cyclase (ATP)
MKYIEIDGSLGEGGGQMLRTTLSLSAILGKPFKMSNIRIKRPKPGLKPQHLMCINAVKQICNANVQGAEIDSKEIIFEPNEIKSRDYEFLIETAGSVSLVIQTILPILIFAKEKSTIHLTGGTHVPFAPSVSYLNNVFLPAIRKMGVKAEIDLKKYGFYPKGGGEVYIKVFPTCDLKAVELLELNDEKPKVEIIICNLPEHILERELKIIKKFFSDIEIKKQGALSPGNIITIYKSDFGVDSIAKLGVPAEKIAEKACEEFIKYQNYPIDKHLTDQLLVYMALCKEKSVIQAPEITQHTKTNIEVIQKFLGNIFEFNGNNIIRK